MHKKTGEKDLERLGVLAFRAEQIVRDEIKNFGICYDHLSVRVMDLQTVGVQGDSRSYSHPLEVELLYCGKFVWNEEFLGVIGSRVPNEIPEINRVVYLTCKK